jgi:hypothetical protein
MKFKDRMTASQYAKIQTISTKRKHIPIKTKYWDMEVFNWVNTWTVILKTSK